MMPRTGSYGETPTVTRSPGTTLIRKRRIRPLSWASTSWPASHCTRYKPPLWTATTVPCMSIRSSLLKLLAFLSLVTNIVPHWDERLQSRSSTSETAYGVFHLSGEGLVILSAQPHRRSKADSHASRPRHAPRRMQHVFDAFEAHRHDGH